MNYQDFLSNNSNINFNVNNENQKLRDELIKYKKENEELKNQINLLNNELAEAKKIISNIKNNNQQNNNISNLNEIIRNKDIEINNLKLQLQNKNNINVNFNDIIAVHFISTDQRINYPITCLKTDTFASVEEKLYQLILRFKKICENNIENGDKIQLLVE